MSLSESVVSLHKRAAMFSLAGSLLRRLANPVSFRLTAPLPRRVSALPCYRRSPSEALRIGGRDFSNIRQRENDP